MAGDKQPKMEEIMASIRRIISDEGEAGRAAQTPDSSEILDLTPAMAEPQATVDKPASSPLSDMLVRDYPGGSNTLEALVRELLAPMLQAWLDTNLPEIVEKHVVREISRITKREN